MENIKFNDFGEVISVNGLTTGQHLGEPMQDAIAEKDSDNEAYGTQMNTVTRAANTVDDKQPTTSGGGGGGFDFCLVHSRGYDADQAS